MGSNNYWESTNAPRQSTVPAHGTTVASCICPHDGLVGSTNLGRRSAACAVQPADCECVVGNLEIERRPCRRRPGSCLRVTRDRVRGSYIDESATIRSCGLLP